MRIRIEGSVKELRGLIHILTAPVDGAAITIAVAGTPISKGEIARAYFVDGGVMIDLHEPTPTSVA